MPGFIASSVTSKRTTDLASQSRPPSSRSTFSSRGASVASLHASGQFQSVNDVIMSQRKPPPPRELESIEQFVQRMRGRKLPSERDLCRQFGVSRGRVRAVLDLLEEQGLVARHQGSGTFALEEGTSVVESVALLVHEEDGAPACAQYRAPMQQQVGNACLDNGLRYSLERVLRGEKPPVIEDGVIAIALSARELQRVLPKDLPAVAICVDGEIRAGGRLSLLQIDRQGAGAAAARQLLAAQSKRLYFLSAEPVSQNSPMFAAAAAAAQEAARLIDIVNDATSIEVPQGVRVGVIATTDALAIEAHETLLARGSSARERTEILSLDGTSLGAATDAAIRTLKAPLETMAADAVAELRRLAWSGASCGREIWYPLR